MATSFQSFVDRENITNPAMVKNTASKGLRSFGTAKNNKTFSENKSRQAAATPRKALGDLGNIQHGTGQKVQSSVKPSKMRIFEDGAKTNPKKSKVKTKKVLAEVRNTNNYPKIEKMTPFVDQENDVPVTPQYITKMLQNPKIFQPSLLVAPRTYTNFESNGSVYQLESDKKPDFDDQMATIIGYDDKLELISVDDSLPCLDDITFDLPLFS